MTAASSMRQLVAGSFLAARGPRTQSGVAACLELETTIGNKAPSCHFPSSLIAGIANSRSALQVRGLPGAATLVDVLDVTCAC